MWRCGIKYAVLKTNQHTIKPKHINDMIWCNAQYKRESLEIVDQTQTPRYVSRFETALRPRLHTEGFPLYVHTGPPDR